LEEDVIRDARVASLDTKVEAVVIPVSDVDRAKEFYGRLGWRLDANVHSVYEGSIGQNDANWPEWYAAYMIAEQAGQKLPQGARMTGSKSRTERYL
jgi:catechol 2,3-dioxygenase-like lactoylglutathione lyase family enzyme